MSTSHLFARCLSAAAAACTLLIAAPSPAAVIASFDPAFGASIPNLGFRGTITLDVTPDCYTLGSGFQFTGGSCQITAQSAEINFYNATTNSAVLATVSLTGAFFSPTYVFGAYFDPLTGQLTGLDTNDSAQFSVSVSDSDSLAPISYDGNMLLYFVSGFAQFEVGRAAFAAATPAATLPGVGGAFLVDCNPANQQETTCQSGDPTSTSNPGRLTFTTVPEPGTVSLAILGLVGLAAARRRTRNA